MAQVTLRTAVLTGNGKITCRKCNEETMVRSGAVLLWDNGLKARVVTAEFELLHRCGRLMEWYCPTCQGQEGLLRGRGWEKTMKCLYCFEPMVQRVQR